MIALLDQPRSLGGAADADGARNHPRHRQCHLPVGDRLAHSASEGEARAADRVGAGRWFFRILLLSLLVWLIGLTQDIVSFRGMGFSWRDIILIAAGCS